MEKFKELSFEEMQEVEGGYWTTYYAQTTIGKCHLAVKEFCTDVSDFISGTADGFVQSFKNTI